MAIVTTLAVETRQILGVTDIHISLPFEVICTVPKKPYGGTIHLHYTPGVQEGMRSTLLEWNSFADYVRSLRSDEYMAEELASFLLEEVVGVVRPSRATVEVVVESAFHLPVTVVASTDY